MTPAAATSISRAASASAAASRLPNRTVAVAAAALCLAGCNLGRKTPVHAASPAGTWHVVAPGESLEAIAKRADVPMADLVEINGLADAAEARPGRLIFILASPGQASGTADDGTPLPPLATSGAPLRWPLATGRIVVG